MKSRICGVWSYRGICMRVLCTIALIQVRKHHNNGVVGQRVPQ